MRHAGWPAKPGSACPGPDIITGENQGYDHDVPRTDSLTGSNGPDAGTAGPARMYDIAARVGYLIKAGLLLRTCSVIRPAGGSASQVGLPLLQPPVVLQWAACLQAADVDRGVVGAIGAPSRPHGSL